MNKYSISSFYLSSYIFSLIKIKIVYQNSGYKKKKVVTVFWYMNSY